MEVKILNQYCTNWQKSEDGSGNWPTYNLIEILTGK
jgi:hypothetical protein